MFRHFPEAYHGESPDLDISSTLQELGDREGLWLRITTIPVDAVDDKHGFSLRQELPTLVGLVGEVYEGPVTDDAEEACKSSFDDEDP